MVDEKGFLQYRRETAVKEFPAQRVHHWHEYESVMPVQQAQVQACRCMDCGTPHCHARCPVHNLIPDWNELVCEGDWATAWEQLEQTNNFPEITGRICPAPCESACTLSIGSQPVTIRCIEQALAEHAWQSGWVQPQRCRRHLFLRVVVVGSGPAGLACAQQLARAGYRVTVYEQADRIGGLLRYGIPDFRLDKRILERRLRQLDQEGVRFRTGECVTSAARLDALRRTAHAVVLACGAREPRTLDVPGSTLRGVHPAMQYLEQQNRRATGDAIAAAGSINACGKAVAVIGGGDTGGDCIGTALRQGAQVVYQLQYHERQPEQVDRLLYWPDPPPEWHPGDHDEEGAKHIWGYDTIAVNGARKQVCGLTLQRLRWRLDATGGRQAGRRRDGPLLSLPVQLVLLAMGFRHARHAGLVQEAGLELDARGNIAANATDYHTSLERVFCCGDMRRGQSLVVWAIREGRQCARAVDLALSRCSDLPYC
jgi:glutamate synthase (NADPH/NADH) small chain